MPYMQFSAQYFYILLFLMLFTLKTNDTCWIDEGTPHLKGFKEMLM